ncbi:unnamed protein product [Rotaria sp. Silwood1]|nr:unnamed protein product [Rotaria sp. Silwood1]CAF1452262.1 unnamed protein product [Rotaria sp. Silwood1]
MEYLHNDYHCQVAPSSMRGSLTVCVLGFLFPFIIIACSYVYTIYYVRQHNPTIITINRRTNMRRDMIILKRVLIILTLLTSSAAPHALFPIAYRILGSLPTWLVALEWLLTIVALISIAVILPLVYECHKYSAANLLSVVSPERKRELHTAAVNCILRDGLALGVFRQPGMSQFLQIAVPGYAGPNGKTVRQKIAAIYSSYTTKLRSVLSKVDFFALTCDLWRSSKRVHYISLTGHVFTNKYKTVSIVLGCHRVIGRHLSTTIERYIEFELKRLNIKQEQLVSITTDNGSDMKKATSTLKFGDDTSHNDPTDDECDSDSDDDINFSSLTINDNKLSSIDHYKLILSVFNLMKKARAGVKFIRNHNGTNEYVIKHVEEFKSIINQMSNISNLLMKRVIITKGFCDLIYDISNNTFQVIEQERDYLENCQKLESTSSPTT